MVNNFELSLKLEHIITLLDVNLEIKKDNLNYSKEYQNLHEKEASEYLKGLCHGDIKSMEHEIKTSERIYNVIKKEVNGILEMIKEEKIC